VKSDPLRGLVHDHEDLNRQVLAIGATVRALQRDGAKALVTPLGDLREQLFKHFAREEEGLFPFVAETLPELADQVNAMAQSHDAICGALVRMVHLAATNAEPASIATIHERFETAYAAHAKAEAELLDSLTRRLDGEQLAALASLVDGL
jgi:iron-sulfur cluster repair protein YtfE (RIC family)